MVPQKEPMKTVKQQERPSKMRGTTRTDKRESNSRQKKALRKQSKRRQAKPRQSKAKRFTEQQQYFFPPETGKEKQNSSSKGLKM